MEQLEILAYRFRAAIEATPRNQLSIGLQDFPLGACSDATSLLGHFLKAQGFGSFDHVSGRRYDGDRERTHAWLQRGDLIIDITADQFPEVDQSVIVANGSAWHETFETEVLHEADFTIYDPRTKATLGADYRAVLQILEATT